NEPVWYLYLANTVARLCLFFLPILWWTKYNQSVHRTKRITFYPRPLPPVHQSPNPNREYRHGVSIRHLTMILLVRTHLISNLFDVRPKSILSKKHHIHSVVKTNVWFLSIQVWFRLLSKQD